MGPSPAREKNTGEPDRIRPEREVGWKENKRKEKERQNECDGLR
jgi:hypothetical protein